MCQKGFSHYVDELPHVLLGWAEWTPRRCWGETQGPDSDSQEETLDDATINTIAVLSLEH